MPEDTIQTLLNSLDLQAAKGVRDRAILLLLTGLGLRAGEIAALRLGDIGWRTGTIRIRGKGDRADELHGRGGRAGYEEVFLTMFEPVRPVEPNGIGKIVRMACARAGITEFGPHRLRHTFATGMLASGATLQEVQGLLRHALRITAVMRKLA